MTSPARGAEDVMLHIDRIRCDGHGACGGVLPERISLDEWGYPIVEAGAVPPELIAHARRAVNACPLQALRLVRPPAPCPVAGGHEEGFVTQGREHRPRASLSRANSPRLIRVFATRGRNRKKIRAFLQE